MEATGGNKKRFALHLIHQPVFVVDAARPEAAQRIFQRLGLACAFVRRAATLADEVVDFV